MTAGERRELIDVLFQEHVAGIGSYCRWRSGCLAALPRARCHSQPLAQARPHPRTKPLLAACDFDQLRDDIIERLGRVDLMCARGTKQRLNLSDMTQDERALLSRLAVIVPGPRIDPAQEHVDRRTQEDDRVEARIEATLIRNRSGDVERFAVVARQKLFEEILPPNVSAVCLRPLAPRCVVSLDDLKAAPCKLGQHG